MAWYRDSFFFNSNKINNNIYGRSVYFISYVLFYEDLGSSYYIAPSYMSNELERTWRESIAN
jgi:hypothetical protein